MSPRKVIGRDGDRVLVDLDEQQDGVELGTTVADDGTVTPALPLLAYDAAGLYDQPVLNPEEVLRKVGNPACGLPTRQRDESS